MPVDAQSVLQQSNYMAVVSILEDQVSNLNYNRSIMRGNFSNSVTYVRHLVNSVNNCTILLKFYDSVDNCMRSSLERVVPEFRERLATQAASAPTKMRSAKFALLLMLASAVPSFADRVTSRVTPVQKGFGLPCRSLRSPPGRSSTPRQSYRGVRRDNRERSLPDCSPIGCLHRHLRGLGANMTQQPERGCISCISCCVTLPQDKYFAVENLVSSATNYNLAWPLQASICSAVASASAPLRVAWSRTSSMSRRRPTITSSLPSALRNSSP